MLRNSGDTNLQQFLGSISIDSNPKSCSQKLKDKFKKPCNEGQSDLDKLWNMRKQSSCKVHNCLPMKTCRAKIAFHANGEELVNTETHGLNLTPNLNVGGNQIGYVYQEKSIVDTDQFLDALRNNNPLTSNVVSKIAEQNHNLFNIPYHSIDGTNTGNPITNKCPPRPKRCPPQSRCKKPDPLLYNVGIGSDGFESRESLRDIIEAGRYAEATGIQTKGNALGQLLEKEKEAEPALSREEREALYFEATGEQMPDESRVDEIPQPAPPPLPPKAGEDSGEATPPQQTPLQRLARVQKDIEGMSGNEIAEYLLKKQGITAEQYQQMSGNNAGKALRDMERKLTGTKLTGSQRQNAKSEINPLRRGRSLAPTELANFYNAGGTRQQLRQALLALERIRPPQAGGVNQ